MSQEKLMFMRHRMVEDQIKSRGVKNERVLSAMKDVPRHRFVGEELLEQAYSDYPLPIGEGQTISQPYVVGLMTELMGLDGTERVLEIGTGSGYQAAVLSVLCAKVYSVEIVESLAVKARGLLKNLGYNNVEIGVRDGYKGWPENAPFDAIMLTAAPPEVPEPLKKQLAEGGVIVAPVGVEYQELIVMRKVRGRFEKESIIPVRFVPMTGEALKTRY